MGWFIATVLVCFVCGWVSYQIGYSNGMTEGLIYRTKYPQKQ
jgi:hypothetical protein